MLFSLRTVRLLACPLLALRYEAAECITDAVDTSWL